MATRQVKENVYQLTTLFPTTAQQVQRQLAVLDLEEIVPPEIATEGEDLKRLENAAIDIDPALSTAANEAVKHYYSRNIAEDHAKQHNGDNYAAGLAGLSNGMTYGFTDNVARGFAQQQNGNNVGLALRPWSMD